MDAIAMDRDLRTVKVAVRDSELPHRTRGCGCNPHRHTRLTQRLGEVLTLGACLLSLVQWPTAMSAPAYSGGIPADRPRFWVNACGAFQQPGSEENSEPVSVEQTVEALKTLIVEVVSANNTVNEFKRQYVQDVFNVNFEENHHNWENHNYNWLSQHWNVPRNMDEQKQEEHMASLELYDFLRDSYRYLQVLAVGLEQVAWDHYHSGSKFAQNFSKVEKILKLVLCEFEKVMYDYNVTPHGDVDRSVMPNSLKDIKDETRRHVRDWLIFRDYMIVLEYVKRVSTFFVNNSYKIKA